MINEKIAIKEIEDLDTQVKFLTRQDTENEYVEFLYTVKIPPEEEKPSNVTLFLKSKNDFDLNDIEKVVYLFKSDFDPNKIAMSNPDKGFQLQIEAFGNFHVIAIVVLKNGDNFQLIQWISASRTE